MFDQRRIRWANTSIQYWVNISCRLESIKLSDPLNFRKHLLVGIKKTYIIIRNNVIVYANDNKNPYIIIRNNVIVYANDNKNPYIIKRNNVIVYANAAKIHI